MARLQPGGLQPGGLQPGGKGTVGGNLGVGSGGGWGLSLCQLGRRQEDDPRTHPTHQPRPPTRPTPTPPILFPILKPCNLQPSPPHPTPHTLSPKGVPLLEIVSAPDMRSGRDAAAYGEELRRVLRTCGVTDGNMAEGSMR